MSEMASNAKVHVNKVHGSLARAGKVKGQTPMSCRCSCCGQNQREKLQGRAGKRKKYNDRIVNPKTTTLNANGIMNNYPKKGSFLLTLTF
jgi:ribosomal protein S30